jgi:hypothetical protein
LSDSELQKLTDIMFGSSMETGVVDVELPDGTNIEYDTSRFDGCYRTARASVFAGNPYEFEALRLAIDDIRYRAETSAFTDNRVRDVLDQWSHCVRTAGFIAPTPNALAEPYLTGSAEPTQEEISAAVASVACGEDTDLIETYRVVRNGYERDALDHSPGLLERWRELNEISLENALRIVAESD